MNLPGRGLTKVEKHCSKLISFTLKHSFCLNIYLEENTESVVTVVSMINSHQKCHWPAVLCLYMKKEWSCHIFVKRILLLYNNSLMVLREIIGIYYENHTPYSMVQSPSWEANCFAASQKIPRISRNPKVHYSTHKRPPPVSVLGQPNPVHIPTSHLLEIHPNIMHPSTPRSPQWIFPSGFLTKTLYTPSPHPYHT